MAERVFFVRKASYEDETAAGMYLCAAGHPNATRGPFFFNTICIEGDIVRLVSDGEVERVPLKECFAKWEGHPNALRDFEALKNTENANTSDDEWFFYRADSWATFVELVHSMDLGLIENDGC